MNRFFVILLAIIFVVINLAASYAYYIYIPEKIEKTVISGINSFGFENPTFSSLSRQHGKIILNDVALDINHSSTIKELRIHFSLLKFLIDPSHAQNITIYGLNLTGKLSKNFIPTITGWAKNVQILQSLHNFPSSKITIDSAILNLISDQFGNISINGSGKIVIGDKKVLIESEATTKQDKLEFTSNTNLSIPRNNEINFKTTLKDFSATLQHKTIKSGNGTIKGIYIYNDKKQALSSLSGDITFDTIKWYDMPLNNVSLKLEFTDTEHSYILNGSTSGTEKIPWNIKTTRVVNNNTKNNEAIYHSIVNLSPRSLYDVQRFLGQNKKLGVNAYIPKLLLKMPSPNITIDNLYNQQKQNTIGAIEIKYKKPQMLINVEYKSEVKNSNNIIGNIEMKETSFRSTPEAKDATRFDISAIGNFTLKNYAQKPIFLWIAHTNIHNGVLDLGPVLIEKIHGLIFLGGSEKQQKTNTPALKFSLPVKNNIKHKGLLFLNINDTQKPLLKSLNLEIYGGTIKTQKPLTKNGKILNNNALDVSNISLEQLTHDAKLDGIFVSGKLAGLIPYKIKDKKIHVTGGLLQNQDSGIIRISKTISKGLFPENTVRNKSLRKALENFHYEFFELRLDGDLTDRVMMTLNARGKNPDVKTKNLANVNLQIEVPIYLLFHALMPIQN